VFPL